MAQSCVTKMAGYEAEEEASTEFATAGRPLLLTPKETAEMLEISTEDLRRMARRGEAPESTKLVGSTMYYWISVTQAAAA